MSTEVRLAQYRDINIVTAEIRHIKETTKRLLLSSYIELGRRLVEAKELLEHGEWGSWLENEVDFSQRTANELMRIFKEYGTEQVSLFGEVNSQALANLSYTQAVLLLKVPKDEREDFVKDNDVENISTRELQELIRQREQERDEALKMAGAAQQAQAETAQELANEVSRRKSAEEVKDSIKLKYSAEQETARNLKKELEEFKKKPVIPSDMLAKIQQEAADKATAELTERTAQAELAAAEAKAQMESIKKELALSGKDFTAFQIHLTGMAESYDKMLESFEKIQASDIGLAQKLLNAIWSQLRKMSDRVSAAGGSSGAVVLPGQTELGG